MSRDIRRFLFVGLLVMLPAAGCLPNNVVWLPDSSGFVYSPGGPSIVHYDVAKKTKRVIVEQTGACTEWPALSPDGKWVAVARWVQQGEGSEAHVIIYDFGGKVVKRSKVERWGKLSGEVVHRNPTYLWWSPDGKRVAVHNFDRKLTLLYDVKDDTFVQHDGIPLPFNGTPFRPDGKGLMLYDSLDRLVFLDLSGKAHEVEVPRNSGFGEKDSTPRILSFAVLVFRHS